MWVEVWVVIGWEEVCFEFGMVRVDVCELVGVDVCEMVGADVCEMVGVDMCEVVEIGVLVGIQPGSE